jgi:hypothetical protein
VTTEIVSIGGVPVPIRDEGVYFTRHERAAAIGAVLRAFEQANGPVELSKDIGTMFLDAFRDACELAWRYSELSK